MKSPHTSAGAKKKARIVKEFQNPIFGARLKETNILSVDLAQVQFDKEEVELVIDNLKHLAADKKYLVLVNSGDMSSITLDGLRVLGREDSFSYAIAKAYVIKTIPQRLMANFYMRFFKPRVPVKFFRSAKDAEVWLLRNFRHVFNTEQSGKLQLAY